MPPAVAEAPSADSYTDSFDSFPIAAQAAQPAIQQQGPTEEAQSQLLAPVPQPQSPPPLATPPPEQIARNLSDTVSNPLNVPVSRQVAVPPPDPIPVSDIKPVPVQQPTNPVQISRPPDEPPIDLGPPDAPHNTVQAVSPPPDAPESAHLPAPQTDAEQAFSAQMQAQEMRIRDLSAQYDHDPHKVLDALSQNPNVPISDVVQATRFAQVKDEGKDDWAKIQDDYVNGAKTVGGIIQGIWNAATHPMEIPNQIGSTVDTAIQAVAPTGQGPNPMKGPTQPDQNLGDIANNLVGNIFNPPKVSAIGAGGDSVYSHSDLIRPQTQDSNAELSGEAQQAQRELVAGFQHGEDLNRGVVQSVVNSILGVNANNPVASMIHAVGGPRGPGVTDPAWQTQMLLNNIPIRSDQDVNNMDVDQLISEANVRRYQANLSNQQMQGYVSPGAESLLDLWSGGKAHTPEELINGGVGVRPTKVNDVAGVTNLALSVPEFAALDGVLGATGAKSLLEAAAARGLQGSGALTSATADAASIPFYLASGASKGVANFLDAHPRAIGIPATEAARALIKATTGFELPRGEFAEYYISRPIGKIATPLVSVPLKGIGYAAGWGSKLIQAVSDPIANWLDVAGTDMINGTNVLASKSPVGNFAGKVAQNVALGAAETYPLARAISPDDPEAQGELMAYGIAGHQIPKTIPDIVDTARNTIADSLFYRDPNQMRGPKSPAVPYVSSRSDLDAQSNKVMNSVITTKDLFSPIMGDITEPAFSPAQRQTLSDARTALNNVAEIHVLAPSDYATEINAMKQRGVVGQNADVASRGVSIDPNPTGSKARVLIRSDAFNDAMTHEIAHPVFARMTPEEQESMFQLASRNNSPDMFTREYTKDYQLGPVNFSDLPTEQGIASGMQQYLPGDLHGLTREDLKKEMVVEAVSRLFNGDTVNSFTRNPTVLRNAQTALGGILGRWGMDPTSDVSRSVLGVKPALPASIVLDSLVRDVLRRNKVELAKPDMSPPPSAGPKATTGGSTGPTVAPKKPSPVATVDEDLVRKVMTAGFTRAEALAFVSKASVVPVNAPRSAPAPSAPSQPSIPSGPSNQAPVGPAGPTGPPPDQPAKPQKTTETTDQTAPLQKVLREDGRLDPGEAQRVVLGTPKAQHYTGKLATLQPDFAERAQAWLADMRAKGYDPQIVQGGRTRAYQQQLYDAYKSGGPNKAGAPGTSYHEFGRAFDWVNKGPDGKLQWNNEKAYDDGREVAKAHELTGISGDNDHLQDARYASYKDIPKGDYQKGVTGPTKPEDLAPHLGGVLRGYEAAFIAAGEKYGVDPRLLAAISILETGHGTSDAAKNFNNVGGMMDKDSPDMKGFLKFRSVDEGIDAMAKNLKEKYLDQGLDTIEKIGAKYAPVGDWVRNDPTHGNAAWPKEVKQIYEALGGALGESSGEPETGGSSRVTSEKGPTGPSQGTVIQPTAAPIAAPEASPAEAKPKVTQDSISQAEADARDQVIQGKNQSDAAYEDAVRQKMWEDLGEQHAASLAPTDQRVRYNPQTGYTSGQFFDPNDPYHSWLLRDQTPQTMQTLSTIQDAIKNHQDIFATYKSAPQAEAGTPTGAQREVAQSKSSAADRASGLASIQKAGKEIAPSWVGVAPGKAGEPNTVIIGGSSSDKISANAGHIIQGLGSKSPYSQGPMGSPMAFEDLKGALWNQQHGYSMSGDRKLTPTPGHEADIMQASPSFQPYKMSKARGDFWNLAAGQGSGAKMSENLKRAPESAAAFEMARANKGFAEGGYSNPLAQALDLAHPPEPVLDSKGNPKIGKDGKAITKTWTQAHLNSPWETLRADNIAEIHDSGGSPYEKIHPGQAEVSKAMEASGTPKSFQSKAGFMPSSGFTSGEYGSGKRFEDVAPGFTGDNYRQFRDFSAKVDRTIRKMAGTSQPVQHDVFGEFPTGVEGSILTEHTDTPYNLVKAGEAAKALHQAQLSSLVWDDHPHGAHALHTIETDLSPKDALAQLSKHGIENKTVLADTNSNEPTRIKLYNEGDISNKIDSFLSDPKSRIHGEPAVQRGRGEFIGDPEWNSRDAARDEYRSIAQEAQNARPDLNWKDYDDHWDEAEQHYEKVKGESLKGTGNASWMPGDAAPAETAGAGNETEKVRVAWKSQGTDSPYFKHWFGNSKVLDDQGEPLTVMHGTGAQIEEFDPKKTNAKTHWFTSDPQAADAYASRSADEIMRSGTDTVKRTPEFYLNLQNPLDASQPLTKSFLNDFYKAWNADRADRGMKPLDKAWVNGAIKDSLTAAKSNAARGLDDSIMNARGAMVRGEGGRFPKVLQKMGYDGIHFYGPDPIEDVMSGEVYREPYDQWGAFKPEQIKSARNNVGTFDPRSGKVNFMPGEAKDDSVEYTPRGNQGPISKASFLPPSKADADLRDSFETPERKAFIAQVQEKAKDWLSKNEAPDLSAAAENLPTLPKGEKWTVEKLNNYLEKQHKQLDLTKPSVRELMSKAVMHDVMAQVAADGSAVGWYNEVPDYAIRHVAEHLDPTILTDPDHNFIYKVAQAITSQNQGVHDNAETGYHAYQYWKEHGELPTTKADLVNGGTQFQSILKNFRLVNKLIDEMGVQGVKTLFDTNMTVKEMRGTGLKISGESPDYRMEGSLALGPKIGAFYSALNKHLENLVMDLWFSRSANRMLGTPFSFKETAFRKQMDIIKNQMQDGSIDVPDARRQKILSEIGKLEAKKTLNRDSVFKNAPELTDWVREQHKVFANSTRPDGTGTYVDSNPVNSNARNMDKGLHKTQDAPKGPKQRKLFREVIQGAQQKIKAETGIDMTTADLQSSLWYPEQRLYKKVGALRAKSQNYDYLDAAAALVDQQKKSPGRPPPPAPKGASTHPKKKGIKLVPAMATKG